MQLPLRSQAFARVKASGPVYTMAGLALLYFLLGFGALQAGPVSGLLPLWPASGMGIVGLLLLGQCYWPAIFIGAWTTGLISFGAETLWSSLGMAFGYTLEAAVGAGLLKKFCRAHPLGRLGDVLKFLVIALTASAIGAGFQTLSQVVVAPLPVATALEVMLLRWLGGILGTLIVGPLLLGWITNAEAQGRGGMAIAVITVAGIGVSLLLFGRAPDTDSNQIFWAFLYVPILGYAALRFGSRGTATLTAAIAVVAITATDLEFGLFAYAGAMNSVLTMSTFLALLAAGGLTLAAEFDGRQRTGPQGIRDALLPWGMMVVALGLTITAWRITNADVEQEAASRFHLLAKTVSGHVVDRMHDYEQILRGGVAMLYASGDASREAWQRYVAKLQLDLNYPGIQGLGLARYLESDTEKQQLIRRVQAEGFPDFDVKPSGSRRGYVVIDYLEPFDWRNRRAHGYDMFSEPVRQQAIAQSRDTGSAAVSGKIILVQETTVEVQAGFLMYLPLYGSGNVPDSLERRREAFSGVVYSPFRMNDLIGGILGGQFPEISLEIFDGVELLESARLFQGKEAPETPDLPFVAPSRQVLTAVDIAGHTWTLRINSMPAFESSIDRTKPVIVLVSGILISLLLLCLIHALVVTKSRALALAQQMTSALKNAETKFTSLAKTANAAILIADEQQRILSSNPAANRMFGFPDTAIQGLSWLTLVPERIGRRGEADWRVQSPPSQGRTICIRQDGVEFPAEYSLSQWQSGGRTFYGAILGDITEGRRAERKLTQARKSAESSSRAKSEFVANMSHEIRTPMNAVLGMAQILARTPLTSEQRRYLDLAQSAGRSLLELLNDILDFSKIEAGRMELASEPFEMADVVRSIATIMAVDAGAKKLELAIGISPEVPPCLIGDELRIRQVLMNLVNNAVKFTEEGEVAVLVECLDRVDGQVRLRVLVRDTGVGISVAQQQRLFSAFSQADSSMTRRFGGTGLGLVISKELTEMMGGQIEVSSKPGVGSEFRVTFVLGVAEEVPSLPAVALEPRRLLLVDDHRTGREYLMKSLSAVNWQVDAAGSAAEALALLAKSETDRNNYHLLLLDWRMPDVDGLALLDLVRERVPRAALPAILMVSSYEHSQLAQTQHLARTDALVLKPVTLSHLLEKAADLLSQQPGPSSNAPETGVTVAGTSLQGIRVLLVEDNVLNQIVARSMLEQAGASVAIAENGEAALGSLRSDAARYDIVLMDVQMPVMDGFTATRIIREELGLTLPVVAMTAGVLESERKHCAEVGMDDFIPKPVVEQQMVAIIRHQLSRASTPETVSTPQEAVSAGLNLDRMLELARGDANQERLIINIIRQVSSRGAELLRQARRNWEQGKVTEAAGGLHSLRGSVGSLGASHFAELTQCLERAILGESAAAEGPLWATVDAEFVAVADEVAHWLDRRTAELVEVDTEALSLGIEELERLRELLAQQNLKAQEYFIALRVALRSRLPGEDMAALEEAMARLDYPCALSIIGTLYVQAV